MKRPASRTALPGAGIRSETNMQSNRRATRSGKSSIGQNLQSELDLRDGCRYGLSDVPIRVHGHEGSYRIFGTHWDAKSELRLTAYPEGPRPREWVCTDPDTHKYSHTMACYNPQFPPGTLHDVAAIDCTLLDRWPVVCCRPRRRRSKR
jgi:hypothetical protein